MHIYGGEHGFVGSVPLVGATIPLAVGSALAAKFDQNGAVAVSYFGDGACEEGVLHESLNLAVTLKLPVLFVCENNLFASHMDIHLRQPSNRMARFAEANRVQARIVDGNDVVAVAAAALELTREMRSGKGPGFIEAVTYRWRGHVGPNMDIDVGVRRTMSDVNAWQKRDPIGRLVKAMEQCGMLSGTEFARLREEELEAVISARDKSREAPYPNPGSLLDKVYKSANPGQRLAT